MNSSINNSQRAAQIQSIVERLLAWGLSPLPVAPAQDPYKYPKKNKQGEILLEDDGTTPQRLYNGKNPSYIDPQGNPRLVNHREYHKKQPTHQEIALWLCYPETGIGCLGAPTFIWIDLDAKHFDSQASCDKAYLALLDVNPVLKGAWLEKTQSGGYRIGLKIQSKPAFTNFSLQPNGKHVGEVLSLGRFAVLAPTIGLSGNPYINLNMSDKLPEIESLESVGIYPVKRIPDELPEIESSNSIGIHPVKQYKAWNGTPILRSTTTIASDSTIPADETTYAVAATVAIEVASGGRQSIQEYKDLMVKAGATGIFLIEAITSKNREILNGITNDKDKSKAFTTALNDLFGYSNWLNNNNIEFFGNPREIALIGGLRLGLDTDRIERIIDSLTIENLQPAAKYKGGDEACWKRIKALSKDAFNKSLGIDSNNKEDIEKDPNQVTTTTEDTIFEGLFQGGKGDYAVLKGAYYRYTGSGYWRVVNDEDIKKDIAHELKKLYVYKKQGDDYVKEYKFATENNKKNAFSYCKSALSIKDEPFNTHLICFRNYTVDLRTGQPQAHDRSNYLTSTIASDYVANAECPEIFKSYIDGLLGESFLPLVQAVIRMFLDPTSLYGYFPHLIGSSGSGKGVFIRFLKSLFSEDNVRSSSDFDDLNTPEKRHQNLTGARLVAFPDLGGFQRGLRSFYELVDNGSMIGRPLFSSSSYDKRWYVRFIIASVDFLQIENSGDGWDRRCIPLPTKPRTKETDPAFEDNLQLVKAEVISWALSMSKEECQKTIIKGHKFNQEIIDTKAEQSQFSDAIKVFADMCLIPSEDPNATLMPEKLYEYYVTFCKANGFSPNNSNKFKEHLRKHVLPQNFVDRQNITIDKNTRGKRPRHFNHIELRPGIFTEIESSMGAGNIIQCNNKFCRDGGLQYIREFWEDKLNPNKIEQQSISTQEPHQPLEGKQLNIKFDKKHKVEEELIVEEELENEKTETIDYENIETLYIIINQHLADETTDNLALGKFWEDIRNRSSIKVQKEIEEMYNIDGFLETNIKTAHELYLVSSNQS